MARSMKEVHTINYYPINEGAARRAKEMNSFSDYKEGSATAEYRAMVDKAAAIAEQQKSRVDPMYHEKIDHLLDTYARKLAENMNQGFAIDARVPSVMIAGPANFPVGKKEKQNRARDSNMEEWRYIQGLLDKIRSTGMGGISADDPAAIEKLQKKLDGLERSQLIMKEVNAYFARRNGLPNPTHFTDDGISGTRFDRPGFLAMMEEVEAGRVEAIVIKDMSRLGRDYLKVGQVMEILRQRGVRLIAINDGVDSLKGDDDFTPFRNIMNEFYARDTSRKIRSVFKSKGMSGKHLTGTVIYGYLWDEKREHWLVDEEATEVVRRIFSLTLEGYGPYQIACKLSADRIEIPVVHLARFNEGVNRSKPVKDPYGWGSSTIVNILKKREYLGHTINFKTRKHFKDKKSHYVSEDKIKAKKKAEMDAKKALIRAEDMKKGVFSTIGQLPKEEPRKGSIAASAAV